MNIEEDDTRIYVDIGYGGYVSWVWLAGNRVDCKIGRTIWAMRATSIKKKASKIRVISK